MDRKDIEGILQSVKNREISISDALKRLKHLPYEDLTFAKIDHHRQLRHGILEVVYAEGKRPEHVIKIAKQVYKRSRRLLVTRANKELFEGIGIKGAKFYPDSRIIKAGSSGKKKGSVLIVSAGTSDIPVAEEAAITASFWGSNAQTLFDVGVAGLHRALGNLKLFDKAKVIVVVAGMEGALPSVIGGMIDKPIIAVPTSTGYGTTLGGLTALFAMLNSCVPGIAVMNIDNGFGAGCLAHKINTI